MSSRIRTGYCLTFVMLFAIGCIWPVMAGPVSAVTVRVACVGDSITYGAFIQRNRLAHAWPGALQKMLGRHYRVVNFGCCGATMLKKGNRPYWKTGTFRESTKFNPNIVLIMLGTNDTKPKNWQKCGSDFAADAEAMIQHFEQLRSHPRVYICTPPPVAKSGAFSDINEKTLVDGVIPAIKKAAQMTGIKVVHVHGQMLKLITKPLPDYYAAHGVHPIATGQAIMARIIYDTVLAH